MPILFLEGFIYKLLLTKSHIIEAVCLFSNLKLHKHKINGNYATMSFTLQHWILKNYKYRVYHKNKYRSYSTGLMDSRCVVFAMK